MKSRRLCEHVCLELLILCIDMGGLGRLATWHLSGGPVGPPSRWSAICQLLKQVTHKLTPLTGEWYSNGGERRERGIKTQKGGAERGIGIGENP